MRLTQHSDYALRMVMYLALRPSRRVTIHEVSEQFAVSRNHLMKVAQNLAAAGFVAAIRGKGGGIRLARPANAMTVGEIVRTMEESFDVVECFSSQGTCRISGVCQLQPALAKALEAFLTVLDGYTVADITRNPGKLAAALGFPLEPRRPGAA